MCDLVRNAAVRNDVWADDDRSSALQVEGKSSVAQVTGTVFVKYNCRSQVCSTLAVPVARPGGHCQGITARLCQTCGLAAGVLS